MKTAAELIKYIIKNDLQSFLFEEISNTDDADVNEFLGKMEQKDYVVNSDEMYCVVYFIDHDIYLRLSGEFDSYGGGEHGYNGEIKEVNPKQKTITVYE